MKLSDLDPNDIEMVSESEDTSVPRLSDLDPSEIEMVESEPPVEKPISKMDSALEGARQGITMGLSDEGTGLVGAGADALQSLLSNLGIASPSPSQVGAELQAKGIQGDIGPTSVAEQYRQMRNEDRAVSEAAQTANPVSYGAGMLAGGVASTPVLPGAMLGNVGKAASAGQRIAAGAKAGALTGAATGAAMSEEDLTQPSLESLLGLGKDVLSGAAVGGTLGTVLPALSETAKLTPALVPDRVKSAFKLGKEGIPVDDSLYTQTKNRLDQKSMEIVDPIIQKVAKDTEKKAQAIAQLDNEINQINQATKYAEEASIAAQTAQNAKELDKVNRGIVQVAKNVQQKVKDVKTSIGKEYEDIDSLVEQTGIFPENREILGALQETLSKSNLKDTAAEAMFKKYEPYLGKKDMQSFRSLKKQLSKDMNDPNYEVARAARSAYSELRNQYMNDLTAGGQQELAKRLSDTNLRWNAVKQIEDNFLDNLYANTATKQVHAAKKTISSIKNAVEKTPEGIASTEELGALLQTADPETAKIILNEMQEIARQQAAAKAFKPQVPKVDNPELQRLEQMLAQVKQQKPTEIPGIQDIPTTSPEAAQKAIQGLIANTGSNTNMTKDLATQRVFDFLKKEVGEDQANKIMQDVPEIAERVRLLQSMGKDAMSEDTLGKMGIFEIINKNMVKSGNLAGRAAKKLEKPASIASKVIPSAEGLGRSTQLQSTELLTKGPRELIESSDEDITQLSTEMKAMGPEGEAYSRILDGVVGKNEVSRNAIIFGLMQRPEFRELLRKMGSQK